MNVINKFLNVVLCYIMKFFFEIVYSVKSRHNASTYETSEKFNVILAIKINEYVKQKVSYNEERVLFLNF